MEVQVFDLDGKGVQRIELPAQFSESVSPSLIYRAVMALQLNRRQPYGTKPGAGSRASAQVSRRRRKYRGSYGKGISRVPRKIMAHSGSQFSWQGAVSPNTVKGRRAHPPKGYTILDKKINRKENRKAVRSALSASMQPAFVALRGHKLPAGFPFVVVDSIASLERTKMVIDALGKLGFGGELSRAAVRRIRAGRGKSRGRKNVSKVGPLLVVASGCPLEKSARNIPGVEVVRVNQLNAELLAPGAVPGRLSLFTASAIARLKDERLFT
ncbi:50S ribosomal protein L4 [Candidatus Woesearchaeota archaeon]|nr:50S ribosomal protein L4 [Candidatus Woesearchaeota archaeon]